MALRIGLDARGLGSPALRDALAAAAALAPGAELVLIHDDAAPRAPAGAVLAAAPGALRAADARRCAPIALNGLYNAFLADLRLDALVLPDPFNPAVALPGSIAACPYLAAVRTARPAIAGGWEGQAWAERLSLALRADAILAGSEQARRDLEILAGGPLPQAAAAGDPGLLDRVIAADGRRFRIALWTPLRPTRSGIADYVEDLLPYLGAQRVAGRAARIDVYTRDEPDSPAARDRCAVLSPEAFEAIDRRRPYDGLIYQVGSTVAHHDYICRQAMRRPGVIVMHDPNLHSYALARGREGYLEAVRAELGEAGAEEARRAQGDDRLRPAFIYRHPLDGWLLRSARAVIYHSHYAAVAARRRHAGLPAFYVPMSAPAPAPLDPRQRQLVLARHGWGPGAVLVGTFGIVAPSKRVGALLRAFSAVSLLHPQAVLLVVGGVAEGDPAAEARRLRLPPDRVAIRGAVDMDEFLACLEAVDIGVALRHPSLGETSAAAIRLIRMGKPVIVSDIPQFRELPDDACWKVPVGDRDHEVETLSLCLADLVARPDLRRAMSRAALRYGRDCLSPEVAAAGYRQVLEHVCCGGPEPRLEETIPLAGRRAAELAALR